MKKISLTVLGMYMSMLAAFSQSGTDSAYKSRKLKTEEVNFVSSYYRQSGSHAAVTGGEGSEQLSDLSNTIDIRLSKYDGHNRKHSLMGEIGIDHYTSASSDKIDPRNISSASHADTRIYPSLNWTMENAQKGSGVGAGIYASTEFDYHSIGGNLHLSKKTKDGSGEFSAKGEAYFDRVTLIYPVELRTASGGRDEGEGSAKRNTFSGTASWSQVINQNLQLMGEAELVYQQGYLGLPFHRVYFNDNSVHVENLPDSRVKIPVSLRANYFLGDRLILRSWYRYYSDNWNIRSHTMQLETMVKLNPFFSITPFYRYYRQNGTDYFAPYRMHSAADPFYTSNYDLSGFRSDFYGAGLRIAPPNGGLGMQHLNALELRYGHYSRTTDLNANIISLHVKFR